jgi:hypothetical protein
MLIIAPNSSRLNLVERGNRSVAEGARALNDTAGLPPTMFLLACVAMVQVDNMVFKQEKICSDRGRPLTPIELWDKRVRGSTKDLFKNVRVFGSLCFALTRTNKQVSKSERCISLGFAEDNPKAYLLMSLERKRFFISRDVVSDETCFPFKKAMTFCKDIPTRYEQGDQGEDDATAFPFEQETQTEDSLSLYDIPSSTVPEEEDEEPATETAKVSSLETKVPSLPKMEDDSEPPQTTHRPSNRRLSFSNARDDTPVMRQLFDPITSTPSTQLDPIAEVHGNQPGEFHPRTSPAKFIVGDLYSTEFNAPARIILNNDDGDVQVVFPDSEEPDKQWTLEKASIDDHIEEAHQALGGSTLDVLTEPLDWIPSTLDGLLVPSCDFALATQDQFDVMSGPASVARLAQQHGGMTRDARFHVALLTNEDLVGKVLADTIDIPKYHFAIKDHPLRPLIEAAMHIEFDTLVRKGVFGKGRDLQDNEKAIGTMFAESQE